MDETTLSTLLERLAADPAPPPAVDITAARDRGRRRLRWRRAGLTTAPLAAAAAAALIVTGTVPLSPGSGPRGGSGNPRPATARPAAPRAPIGALAPYASFGWLPAGFSVRGAAGMWNQPEWTPQELTLAAGAPTDGRVLVLMVNAAGSCHLTGPRKVRTGQQPALGGAIVPHVLDCTAGTSGLPVTGAAPAVRGAPAFWGIDGRLLWEYTRGGWAQLLPAIAPPAASTGIAAMHQQEYRRAAGWQPGPARHGYPATGQSAATRSLLHKAAGHVSYGGAAAMLFPFQLTGIPVAWQATDATFSPAGGRLLDTSLQLGPASAPSALQISVTPAGAGPGGCGKLIPGQSRYVTAGGARGVLRTIGQPYKHEQDLCFPDYHGWSLGLYLQLNRTGSNAAVPGAPPGVLAVLHHLQLLGRDPAGWTRTPLR